MTILEPNQPWPQIKAEYFNPSIGVFGGYEFDTADQSVGDLVCTSKDHYTYRHNYKPSTLFAGPKAMNKISNYIAENLFSKFTTREFSKNQKREFLGMELVLTVDDGLWIA